MNERIKQLEHERTALQQRIAWLGLKSTGSDKHEQRIREIERELSLFKWHTPTSA